MKYSTYLPLIVIILVDKCFGDIKHLMVIHVFTYRYLNIQLILQFKVWYLLTVLGKCARQGPH